MELNLPFNKVQLEANRTCTALVIMTGGRGQNFLLAGSCSALTALFTSHLRGMTADAGLLHNFMFQECADRTLFSNRPLPVSPLVSLIRNKTQIPAQQCGQRPYGARLYIASYNHMDPPLPKHIHLPVILTAELVSVKREFMRAQNKEGIEYLLGNTQEQQSREPLWSSTLGMLEAAIRSLTTTRKRRRTLLSLKSNHVHRQKTMPLSPVPPKAFS